MPTNHFGKRVTAAPIITGQGLLHGFLVSHNQATVQTLTFYNNTAASGTVLLQAYIAPEQNPVFILFPRRHSIPFTTGLSASYTNCDLSVWATDLD
jgi:hypothetical protein